MKKIIKSKTIDYIKNNKLKKRLYLYYDEYGNEIKSSNSDGYSYTKEYNDKNLEISFKDTNGVWYTKEYNDLGLETKFEHSSGAYEYKEYDSEGNITIRKDHLQNLYFYDYYDNKCTITNAYNNSYKEIVERRKDGTIISRNIKNYEYNREEKYNMYGNIIYSKTNGNVILYKYYDSGEPLSEIREGDKMTLYLYEDDKIICKSDIQESYVSYLNDNKKEIKRVYEDGTTIIRVYNEHGNEVLYSDIEDDSKITCYYEYY